MNAGEEAALTAMDYSVELLTERCAGLEATIQALTAELASVKAERDRVMATADVIDARYQVLIAERDQLAAQVAALVDFISNERDTIAIAFGGSTARAYDEAISNLPAAAAVFVAAHNVCKFMKRDGYPDEHTSSGVSLAWHIWDDLAARICDGR